MRQRGSQAGERDWLGHPEGQGANPGASVPQVERGGRQEQSGEPAVQEPGGVAGEQRWGHAQHQPRCRGR
eukprot:6155567-Prorocentrum_lima.AAC.1